MSCTSNYYSLLLKKCCHSQNFKQAKKIHGFIIKAQEHQHTFLSNTLITTYNHFGNVKYARHVFDHMPQPNPFSWNILLSAYSKSGRLVEMLEIFNCIPIKDGISWNVFISGYVNCRRYGDAVRAYKTMLLEGTMSLNRITFSTMLMLSSDMGCIDLGRQLHGQIIKFGFLYYVFVANPLIDMYSKLNYVYEARQVFEEAPESNLVMYNTMLAGYSRLGMFKESWCLLHRMPYKDSITWTTMITGLTQNGLDKEAVVLMRRMQREGFPMDHFTFGSVLAACGRMGVLKEGKELHAYIIRTGYQGNIFVGSALVDMYSKCNCIRYAKTVFKNMTCKNTISWSAMLVGYSQSGLSEEAIKTYLEMQKNRIEPDYITLGSVISSCANSASLEEGVQFHKQALVSGLQSFVSVSNALITLYGRCGIIEDSLRLFGEMNIRDEISWTALISSYAQFGKARETLHLYEEMVSEGLKPDETTFVSILSACSRAGLVEEGKQYFELMVNLHGIVATPEHYACMIDLFSRAGRLEEAKSFISEMPYNPDAVSWGTLLSSCRFFSNIEIGKWAAEKLFELEPQHSAGYVLLSSIYAAEGKWQHVAQLRKGMRDKGIKKEPGYSWIKFKNKVHVFSADDQSSPYMNQIYAEMEKLDLKMVEEGYKPDLSSVLHDVEDSEKIRILKHHSERLAIFFGLIFVPPGRPIRVVKNLRVCGDCHTATKFISKITQREILVRDSVRFHLFKNGTCSCGDFW
ncbi:putative pentatricopeptide repeat-containing protein At1g68930 [Amaranthus tricolor]|uniref:putative pentatricopeptide repeat-containing protein At1g68930 n=1 Tax=Amaranthus tricolor TaxID=29722 RepID=UPI0025905359|nr:putative pentatricopeptide repeat-containing protein At1g68930 [Amaranthus tricolor]XP_057528697.1 putative pentatricopeptide repeat-containing protein At1g68930 [Amaranthus tricolor]XP_057528698.1 putative pentatricopeptide repeat-containing protein At1g68930 [Amaranthus tricolor]